MYNKSRNAENWLIKSYNLKSKIIKAPRLNRVFRAKPLVARLLKIFRSISFSFAVSSGPCMWQSNRSIPCFWISPNSIELKSMPDGELAKSHCWSHRGMVLLQSVKTALECQHSHLGAVCKSACMSFFKNFLKRCPILVHNDIGRTGHVCYKNKAICSEIIYIVAYFSLPNPEMTQNHF